MKNIYYKIILVCLVGFMSCEDVLDQPPLHAPDESLFWTTEADAQKALNQLYAFLPNTKKWWTECISDNAVMTNAWGEGNMGEISQGKLSATTGFLTNKGYTDWKYDQIRHVHYFLENISLLKDVDADVISGMEGEARFLLALRYFRISRTYGDVPLPKKTLTLDEANEIGLSPQKEVFAYALENANTAVTLLEANDVRDTSGRITQDAAIMLKTEILIWMASMEDFRETSISDTGSAELWGQAATTVATLIDKNRYELHPDLVTLFHSSTNYTDNETILARNYKEDDVTNFQNILGLPGGTGIRGGGWASFAAPRNLIDEYEVEDGMPIQTSPNYDIVEPFKNRDKRLTSWFLLPGVDVLRQSGDYTPFDSHPDNGNSEALGGEGGGGRTGYWCTKYVELGATTKFGYQNWIIYRYGEALLLLAEALNESNPSDPRILSSMNEIRTRAGLPGVDALLGDQVAMREAIRHERRVELVNEEKRLWDIMRWKTAHIVLNPTSGYNYGINESLEDYTNKQGDWTVPQFAAEPQKFENHFYFWPIPQSVIDNSPNINQEDQNPGY